MAKPKDKPQEALRVLFAAAEADPIIKVGGLGDVAGSLPQALRALSPAQASGHPLDIRLVIPFYPAVKARIKDAEWIAAFEVPSHAGPISAQAYQTSLGELPVYLIDGAPIASEGPIYHLNTRKDGEKFTFFSLALLELARALDWAPDILHANDWHTAIAVHSLALRRAEDPFFAHTRSVLTIHSLPFMGAGTEEALAYFDVPPSRDARLPAWAVYQPLPMGLAAADFITTVSPTFSRQILTPEYGCGLEDFLRQRSETVVGILNGLDETVWDPATDQALAATFTRESLARRKVNKQSLLDALSLSPDLDIPLLVFIGRMDQQKGIDLIVDGLRELPDRAWQAILLGTGDPALEAKARQLKADFPRQVRAVIRFDAALSHRLYGGGDMLMMPSRFEPCGLAQMIAMHYGCPPVARATGGLCDTIKDEPSPETSTGFLFNEATPQALAAALQRALSAFSDQKNWQIRQINGMQQDFSWKHSSEAYAQIYHQLLLT